MVIDRTRTDFSDFTLHGQNIEEVTVFNYLGSMINTDSSVMQEVSRRINIARTAVRKMDKIWKSKAINNKLKLRLARTTAFAIASYGSETWTISDKVKKKINAFEMWTYRRIMRVSWREKKTNEWVLHSLGTVMLLYQQIVCRKLRFFGHIMRHDSLEKAIIQGKVEGMRGRGRPRRAWYSDIEEWVGCSLHRASQLSERRDGWRDIVKATAARLGAN